MKKALKITGKILIVILGLLIAGSVVLFFIHRSLLDKERGLLRDKGYLNPVSVGDHSLNVCSYGSDSPKHTLVGIAGLGIHNISITYRPMTDRFAADNKIVLIDRAGCGASDDSTDEQTTEHIVEEYRTALKNAGFSAPYILLPHSIGAAYASYWESKYPEEVEGIVYLDGTPINDTEECFDDSFYDSFTNTVGEYAFKIGWQRLVYSFFDSAAFSFTTGEEQELDKAMTWKNALSSALNSEMKLMNSNVYSAYKSIVPTDIPKAYISASAGMTTREEFVEYRTYMYNRALTDGRKDTLPEFTDEYVDSQLKLIADFRENEIMPFIEHIGNCTLESIPATHMVYCDFPEKCADVIEELIERTEK